MSDERPSTGSYAGWGLGGLILVYFGFPALWIWPIWKVYGMRPPQWFDILLAPLVWLAERLPIYGDWVDWGIELFGIK